MRKTIQIRIMVLMIALAVLFHTRIIETNAAGERVYFGSEGYEWALDSVSPIGIYTGAEQNLSSVELYVRYDSGMLEFSSGGQLAEPGLVRISAEGIQAAEYMQMLQFIPRTAGFTTVTIESGTIVNETGEQIPITPAAVNVAVPMAEGSSLDGIQVNGNPIPGFIPTTMEYQIEVAEDAEEAHIVVQPGDRQVQISDTKLAPGENVISITTTNDMGNRARYLLRITRPEMKIKENNIEQTALTIRTSTVVIAEKEERTVDFQVLLIIVMAVLLIFLTILVWVYIKEKKRKEAVRRRNRRQNARVKKADAGTKPEKTVLQQNVSETEAVTGDPGAREGSRVLEISVQNVTMEFKREKDESTSIKELLIRTFKRQRSYEYFRALDNVSFDIYKGEVVGVIGTNGSGKSTILKIISGALIPTAGKVEVDRNKIQLLTLGTGFDSELTGRENVYLNGAIIGYTKEYIDEKYNDIVKFAELEGFMEEKVRNYSSGMVSRLGFAIATVRDTPEILILDEVLSVGDMFFRKKSENRIKEMMHGGSTVLIVSHSTSVIRNNCTKAVWIEKGILRAIGDPEEVCAAYEKMNETAE